MTTIGPIESINAGRQSGLQDEADLIRQAQLGDVQAFEQIVHHYQLRVLSLACSIVDNPADARDVAQEVFIRVYRFLPSFDCKKKFFTWVYRIVINCSFDFLKREKKFRTEPLDENSFTVGSVSINDSFSKNEFHAKVYELLETLSIPQKTAFVLRDVEGLSCKEAAKILECPSGTVRSHLHFARSRLRVLLKKHYPEFLEGIVS